MNLYKVIINGIDDSVISYDQFKHGNQDSLFFINEILKSDYRFPLLNGDDMSRLRGSGGTLLWCGTDFKELYYLVDIDYKNEGQWTYDELPQKFELIGKTIKRDIKLKQVI